MNSERKKQYPNKPSNWYILSANQVKDMLRQAHAAYKPDAEQWAEEADVILNAHRLHASHPGRYLLLIEQRFPDGTLLGLQLNHSLDALAFETLQNLSAADVPANDDPAWRSNACSILTDILQKQQGPMVIMAATELWKSVWPHEHPQQIDPDDASGPKRA